MLNLLAILPAALLLSFPAQSSNDTTKVNALNSQWLGVWQRGEYEKAMEYADEARTLAQKAGFKKGEATALINTSLIYWKQGEYGKALDLGFKALKMNEDIGNKPGISRSHNGIGLICFNQKNYAEALEQYNKALKIREETGDQQGVAGTLNNIGEVYKEQGDYSKAMEFFLKSLKMNESIGNRNYQAININNIGGVYFAMGNREPETAPGYYKQAIEQYQKALKIREEVADSQGIAQSCISIGELNLRLKNYKEAEKQFETALACAGSIGYKEAVKEAYRSLSVIDSTMGNWQQAYLNFLRYTSYKDSLLSDENIRESVRAKMNFTFDRKQEADRIEQAKKDAIVEQEKRTQRIILIAVSAGLILVLVLAGVIWRSLKQNQEKNRIILAQKQLVEKQKHLVEEKQKEITDSINYAERIQRSFLATEQLLNAHLEEYFVLFRPKDIVSGDFYWATVLNNGQFAIVTADSTGHGVPGAIMSILNISCLEKSVEDKGLSGPAEILNYARTKIIERLKKDGSPQGGKDGMDCSLISFAPGKASATYAAANNPVWVVRGAELLEFAPDKMPVGKHDKDSISFTEKRIDLQKGDMVYALTDGMPDQFGGPKGKKFMYKQLKELLTSLAPLPASEQKEKLNKAFSDWKGDLEQIDDVCVIGIRA